MVMSHPMSTHGVADAKNHLSALALAGERVVITRRGHPVVEIRAVAASPHRVTAADIDWLDAHRVGAKPAIEDAGTTTSHMRDEDWR